MSAFHPSSFVVSYGKLKLGNINQQDQPDLFVECAETCGVRLESIVANSNNIIGGRVSVK